MARNDPILLLVLPERRKTLMAEPVEGQPQQYETVFFNY
jgi:hypothetical protein